MPLCQQYDFTVGVDDFVVTGKLLELFPMNLMNPT